MLFGPRSADLVFILNEAAEDRKAYDPLLLPGQKRLQDMHASSLQQLQLQQRSTDLQRYLLVRSKREGTFENTRDDG